MKFGTLVVQALLYIIAKFYALIRGRNLYSTGRPSRWALAHILVMVAVWNRADHYIFMPWFVMVALCNRADHYIFMLFLLLSFFSSPNLSGRRLDVYHTLAHGVALVQI